jgi:MOSC domain-containing protein YiiM
MEAKVVSLQLCPGHRKPMTVVEKAEAVAGLGLKHDLHALPDSSRQVLLLESETLAEFGLKAGEMKENITTAGIRLTGLPPGARLRIGNGVVLTITEACSPCSRMEEIRPGFVREIAGKRGMLARVLTGGNITTGDTITEL